VSDDLAKSTVGLWRYELLLAAAGPPANPADLRVRTLTFNIFSDLRVRTLTFNIFSDLRVRTLTFNIFWFGFRKPRFNPLVNAVATAGSHTIPDLLTYRC